MVREAEEELRKELTSFRNTVSFALLFINICFFVFAVTLKAYANELPGYKLSVPVQILVSHLRDCEQIFRNFRKFLLPCSPHSSGSSELQKKRKFCLRSLNLSSSITIMLRVLAKLITSKIGK